VKFPIIQKKIYISKFFPRKKFWEINRKNKSWFIFSSYLPNSLEYLKLGNGFNQPINNLPLKLKEIDLLNCIYRELIKENLLDVIPINCSIIK
jgi:hypothetical protein